MKYSIYEIHQHDMLISNNTDDFFVLKKLDEFNDTERHHYNEFYSYEEALLFIKDNEDFFQDVEFTIIPSFRLGDLK